MIKNKDNLEILPSKNRMQLFGYEKYFDSFAKLYKNKKLPNTILFSGPKGSGKATFAYHFINYLLSKNEPDKYSTNNFTINPNNKSYKNLCENIHPNFLLLDNDKVSENIKIDSVRNVLSFINKSTYLNDIKIILIDNAEYLNIHSSNALLKSLEEPNDNTFFFIIHDSSQKILNTIKSRCVEFRFFFDLSAKKKIFGKIANLYNENLNMNIFDDSFYFDTPGNILRYLIILRENNIHSLEDKLSSILLLFNYYKVTNDSQTLSFITILIELFYNELSIKNSNNLNLLFANKFKVLKQINDMKKFKLDKKNLLISLQKILENE